MKKLGFVAERILGVFKNGEWLSTKIIVERLKDIYGLVKTQRYIAQFIRHNLKNNFLTMRKIVKNKSIINEWSLQ